MCPPDYYGIEYEINPWMDRRRPADTRQARDQWEALYHTIIQELTASVELLTPVPGLPDLVFTANGGFVGGDTFIVSNFRYSVRAREAPYFQGWFQKRGFKVVALPSGQYFEGEGDILPLGDELFAGYRFRSDVRSHLTVGSILSRRVFSLELVDPRFYHLDTCFCPLGEGAIMYYPNAFDVYGRRVIQEHIPLRRELSSPEALRFAANAIVVGKKVILNSGCPQIKGELEGMGYTVYEVDLSEFIKAGGSAKCLVLFVER
ncbi:MAG: amidinotransferase [Chloroflexi bacterium]|nr:amidinotransferase [Chloroflexota bacterium]